MSNQQPDDNLVLVLQERTGNSTLTVQYRGRVLGTVLQDYSDESGRRRNFWKATPVGPNPNEHETLEAAVRWLVAQETQ